MPKDSFEQLFEQSDKSPSKNVLVELLSRNSANTAHRPLPGTDVRYWPYSQMNYGGFTVADNKYLVDGKEVLTGGPAPGSMWVNTYPRKNFDLPEVSNIYSHEALHSRASQAGGLPLKSSAELSAIQQGILKRMRLYQDSKAGGPYWGMRPESSIEETIAALAGYEGSLPKGTSILDT